MRPGHSGFGSYWECYEAADELARKGAETPLNGPNLFGGIGEEFMGMATMIGQEGLPEL